MKRAIVACALALGACGDVAPASIGADPTPTLAPADLPAFFDCLRVTGQAVASAHRAGPRPGYAENAIETMRMTIGHAPAFLEVDVSRTRDGALVLMHDDTVDRTTSGAGAVSALTLEQFQALRLQDNAGAALQERPPTLRQALDWAEGLAILELDVKRAVAYEDVVREVEAAGAMGRVVFITYSIDGAARLAALAPQAMIYTTISTARELDVLERRGVHLNRIVAWIGTGAPQADLVSALTERGVEARMGMFGADRDYANAARAGVQMVAADDAAEAVRDLDASDGADGYAALECARQR